MRIHNLYTDANGESHFSDIEIEWTATRRGSKLSKRLPATGVIFRETAAEHNVDWHPAPRRQYIVNLDAGVKITASDGESRFVKAGEIILVEDTHGKGHLSDHIENKIPFDLHPDRVTSRHTYLFPVMAGLVPAIHVYLRTSATHPWMPGTSPGMTKRGRDDDG